MRTLPEEHLNPTRFQHEFIPPLNAREAWGVPWERQLAAHRRWQEAGGNADGQACQWVDPALAQFASISEQRRSVIRQRQSTTGIADERRTAANEPYPRIERRHHALAIGFPDRRMAG